MKLVIFLSYLIIIVKGEKRNPSFAADGGKIVRGTEAKPNSFPYQAGITVLLIDTEDPAFCGGSIINNICILTAAHCVDRGRLAEVVLGAHRINEVEATQQVFVTNLFSVHPDWNRATAQNDIALIRLPYPANFTAAVQPIPIVKNTKPEKWLKFKKATVTGWGKTSDEDAGSDVLMYMTTKIISRSVCERYYKRTLTERQLCVDGSNGMSTCGGDSGGPLVIKSIFGQREQQGLVSYGSDAGCEARWPQVFTNVPAYITWIKENCST